MTSNGAMFPIDAEAVKAGVTNRRIARIDTRLLPVAFAQTIRLGQDEVVFAGPPPTSHMVVADLTQPGLTRVPLRIDSDIASTNLAAYQGAILAACETGPVHLLEARSGKTLAKPFVPRMEPGNQVDWLLPAQVDKTASYVAAERNGKIYLVIKQGATFSITKQAEVAGPLVAGLATLGPITFAISGTSGADEIIAIDQNLSVVNTTPLPAGVAWGPHRVGDHVLVTDRSHTLTALNDNGSTAWSLQLPGPVAGAPLAQSDKLIVSTTDGTISVLNSGSGQTVAQRKLTEPLGGAAVAYRGRLLVAGWDGTLYLIDVPKS